MATAKKGLIEQAMDVVSGVFTDEPRKPPRRATATKAATKKTTAKAPVKKAAKKMDRKLVAGKQAYEVTYEAKKLGIQAGELRGVIAAVGHSRVKIEAAAKKLKG